MATKTNRAQRRADASKRKHNQRPYLPTMTVEMFNASLDVAVEKAEQNEIAKAHRAKDGLLLVLNERAHEDEQRVRDWNDHYAAIISERTDEPAKQAKKRAEDYFSLLFKYRKEGNEGDAELNRIRNRKTNAMQTMRFVYYLQIEDLLDSFTFTKDGASYITPNSPLYMKVMATDGRPSKWKADTSFKREVQRFKEGGAWNGIELQETRTTQVGRLTWAELQNIVVPSSRGGAGNGDANKSPAVTDSATAVENFNRAASYMMSHFEPAKSAANVRKALQSIYDATRRVMNVPGLVQHWTDVVEPALKEAMRISGIKDRPDGKLQERSGEPAKADASNVLTLKRPDVITPDSVKSLPPKTKASNGNSKK